MIGIYFSNLPKIMRDFIQTNATHFAGKRTFIIATMGLFSGDGAGVSARLLKKQGASHLLPVSKPDYVNAKVLEFTSKH